MTRLEDLDVFTRYLDQLDRADPVALPPAERLALWINAYSAYTIALINRHNERPSIRNINRAFGIIRGKGPWAEPIVRVGGRTYTPDQIEDEVIRKRFSEPRFHFALVCAAVGCPPLRTEAYTGQRLDSQLQAQAFHFLLSSPAKNRIDAAGGVAHLSPIFRWYREDFGGSDDDLLGYLAGFFPAGAARESLERGDLRITYTEYDWSLNGQQRADVSR